MTAERYHQPLSEKAQAVNDLLAEGGEWNVVELRHALGFDPKAILETLYVRGYIDRHPPGLWNGGMRRWYHV